MNGVLVVDKPEGPTSHDVVSRARRALAVSAIGHTGTLDPMATGVLVLVLGRATRLARFMTGHEKAYEATFRLGVSTDTWDRTGRPAARPAPTAALPGAEAVTRELASFLGAHEQRPPRFSAKKVDGVRAHVLARRGADADLAANTVELLALEVVRVAMPLVDVRLRCSAGYYVRALAHDLGERLRCGACLERLRRTAAGPFTTAQAVGLDALEGDRTTALGALIPPEALLAEFPALILSEDEVRRVRHGNDIRPMPGPAPGGAPAVRLLGPDGRLLAVARPGAAPGVLHPSVVLG
jgi:tRNA pseudouridine55 synthase